MSDSQVVANSPVNIYMKVLDAKNLNVLYDTGDDHIKSDTATANIFLRHHGKNISLDLSGYCGDISSSELTSTTSIEEDLKNQLFQQQLLKHLSRVSRPTISSGTSSIFNSEDSSSLADRRADGNRESPLTSSKIGSSFITKDETSYFFTITLHQPTTLPYLDHKSNSMATMLIVEKRELEHSLNWLSTLGGAFSALGENDYSFAERAGKVSKGQLLIALKLSDHPTMSRCRLFTAISLIQLGKLKIARQILEREWAYAKSLPPGLDPRLRRMCIGIWSKLQWAWKQTHSLTKNNSTTAQF